MCKPHCWQYANPTGVGVPQRGHVTLLPCAAGWPPLPGRAAGPEGCPDATGIGGTMLGGGRVGGGGANAPAAGGLYAPGLPNAPGCGIPIGPGGGIPIGPGGGMAPIGPGGGMPARGGGAACAGAGLPCCAAMIWRTASGVSAISVAGTGMADGGAPASALPQLRQNFMPGGFSPRHTPHTLGNPAAGAGVWPKAGASELPQLRQNADPDGLSWPHIEQRIGPR